MCFLFIYALTALSVGYDEPLGLGRDARGPWSSDAADDVFCGPRCLRFILRQYGRHRDLIDLVRAAQWPDIDKGASLAALEAVLRENGVGTQGVRVPSGAEIRWPYPVLLHCVDRRSESGHYVVLLRTAGDMCDVYWGVDGCRRVGASELASLSSGVALLTAPSPGIDPNEAVDATCAPTWARGIAFAAALAAIAAAAQLFWFQFSRQTRRKRTCVAH